MVVLGGLEGYAVQWVKGLAPYVNVVEVDVKEEVIDFVSKILKLDIAIDASKVDPAKSISKITKDKGVKAVIDIVDASKTVGTYINVLAKTGIYVLVGMMGIGVTIALLLPFIVSEKTITGSIVGTLAERIEVVNAVKRGAINYKAVVSRKLRFEEATEGLEALKKGKVLGRQVMVF